MNKYNQWSKKNRVLSVLVLCTLIVYLITYIINLVMTLSQDNSELNPQDNNNLGIELVDALRTNIPTYSQLNQVMSVAVKDIYGKEFDDLELELSKDFINIPNTGINLSTTYMVDSTHMAYITFTALSRNPYIQQSIIEERDIVKQLPNGTEIVINNLEQNYTGLELFVSEYDKLKVTVRGYDNGNYFTEDLDMKEVFNEYLRY